MTDFWRRVSIALKRNYTFRRFFYSFPFRLVLLDAKKNIPLLLFWAFVFAMVTENMANSYGVPFLFLGPEYLNHMGFLSYFIVGFSCGGFIMAYHISSFIRNADRFPFIASIRYPFMKYCLNNFFMPFLFLGVYCVKIYYFLKGEDNFSTLDIYLMILSFLGGVTFFLTLTFSYFLGANKDIFKLFGIKHKEELRYREGRTRITGERNPKLITEERDWYVETYFTAPGKVRLVRSVQHYKKEVLKEVLARNSHSAFVFQMFALFSLLALSFLGGYRVFEIPAGASIFLLLTTFMMVFSSLYRLFSGWSTFVFILLFIAFNQLHKYNLLAVDYAYGLNYKTEKADYSLVYMSSYDANTDYLKEDIAQTTETLNKWKAKNTNPQNPDKKPKLIFVNTSGGGLRASLWTFYALQYMDSLVNGKLMSQTQMITGSSGGMVGAAYLRELYYLKQQNKIHSYYQPKYITNVSKDVLNAISFKIATSEWFFPMQFMEVDSNRFPKDRAYALECSMLHNLDSILYKRLGDYKQPEQDALVPMMVFAPSIVNDGRKLLISPVGISYLTQNMKTSNIKYQKLYDNVEYSRLFEKQNASQTFFSSVIRMSATFPYISPSVSLPSNPIIEVVDAGYRDNYGLESSLSFIHAFNDWIAENTSGIVIIQLRDKNKTTPIDENPPQTFSQALGKPMGSFYGNLFNVQDFSQNKQIQLADAWCKSDIEFVDLQLHNDDHNHISLNWHLTNKEKKQVLGSLFFEENQKAIKRLQELLN